jgi:hypothetical protein
MNRMYDRDDRRNQRRVDKVREVSRRKLFDVFGVYQRTPETVTGAGSTGGSARASTGVGIGAGTGTRTGTGTGSSTVGSPKESPGQSTGESTAGK